MKRKKSSLDSSDFYVSSDRVINESSSRPLPKQRKIGKETFENEGKNICFCHASHSVWLLQLSTRLINCV